MKSADVNARNHAFSKSVIRAFSFLLALVLACTGVALAPVASFADEAGASGAGAQEGIDESAAQTVIGEPASQTLTTEPANQPIGSNELSALAVDATIRLQGTKQYTRAPEVLTLVNQERAKVSASALKIDAALTEAAMQRAAECAVFFNHTRPSGASWSTALPTGFVGSAGENIAGGYSTSSAVMSGWMGSAGHKANILNSSYSAIGIGSYTHNGITFWVQLFRSSAAQNTTIPTGSQASTNTIDVSFTTCKFSSLNILSKPSTLNRGAQVSLTVSIVNADWKDVSFKPESLGITWLTSNSSILTASNDGRVTAVGSGTAIITARLGPTASDFATISVPAGSTLSVPVASNFTYSLAAKTYTGQAQGVTVVPRSGVTGMGTVAVRYNGNTTQPRNAGTYAVTIDVAAGAQYSATTGLSLGSYTINRAHISSATIAQLPAQTYSGNAITPVPVVKFAGVTLVANTDYTLSYSNNISVGTASVTFTGKGNFTGSTQVFFEIKANGNPPGGNPAGGNQPGGSSPGGNQPGGNPPGSSQPGGNSPGGNSATSSRTQGNAKDISSATIAPISARAYTSSAITPAVSVTYEGKALAANVDYTVSYTKNVNIGTASITIAGKGAYTNKKTVSFKIVPKKTAKPKVTVGKNKMNVKWKAHSKPHPKATKYQVHYRVAGTKTWKTKTVAGSATKKTITKLAKGKKYQAQVRSYKMVKGTKYYSTWSKTRTSKRIK